MKEKKLCFVIIIVIIMIIILFMVCYSMYRNSNTCKNNFAIAKNPPIIIAIDCDANEASATSYYGKCCSLGVAKNNKFCNKTCPAEIGKNAGNTFSGNCCTNGPTTKSYKKCNVGSCNHLSGVYPANFYTSQGRCCPGMGVYGDNVTSKGKHSGNRVCRTCRYQTETTHHPNKLMGIKTGPTYTVRHYYNTNSTFNQNLDFYTGNGTGNNGANGGQCISKPIVFP